MPLPKDIKPKISEFTATALGQSQALIVTKVNKEVDRITEELLSSCPPVDRLERLAKIIQNLKPAIDQSDEAINFWAKTADTITPIVAGLTLLVELLIKEPRGTVSFNGNPSPFQPVFAQPAFTAIQPSRGKIRRTQEKLRWLQNAILVFGDDFVAASSTISSAKNILSPVKQKIEQIDALIQACFENQDLSDEERKLLLNNIQGSYSDPAFTSVSYRSRSGKDYTIKIIKDPNSPEIAPKRQAIVQDFRGITVLTGPSSFASKPQVLVDEIKFRIENQLP